MNVLDSRHLHTLGDISVFLDALEEDSPDLSWDDTGETTAAIARGDLFLFCARIQVLRKGVPIGSDYLGNCVYHSLDDFMQPRGYFIDMVREAFRDAREWMK